jgi:hypothetical protein
MTLTGTSNGQDAAKRAAMIRYAAGGPGGGQTVPQATPTGAPAPGGGGSVTDQLLSAAQQTVSDKANYQENIGAWKQALSFLAANLPPDVLQGGQQGAAPQEPISPAMAQGAAQGAPSTYARPPR